LTEKEIEIVYDLAQRVLRYENVLIDASDICGDIDRLVLAGHDASFIDTNSTAFLLSHRQPASIS
jgi:DNA mismatch repair protein MSH5